MRSLPVLLVVAAMFAACPPPTDSEDAGQPPIGNPCKGGIITDAGECVAKCDPSKCTANNTCVDNRCQLECTAHSQCKQYVQECLPAKEDDTGRDIFVCTDVAPREYGDPCPNGTECAEACVNWDGPADTDAYCAPWCATDADCPGGHECIYQRDPHPLCEDINVGNSGFCGKTDEACVSEADVELPDSGWVNHPFCLQRGVCMRRDACSPCTTDIDCSYGTDLSCQHINGTETVCVARCAQDGDCSGGFTCEGGFCFPPGATCKGDGEFCSLCKSDLDCTLPHACVTLHGTEKACVDVTLSIDCETSADCPQTPGGHRAQCNPRSDGSRGCFIPYDGDIYTCY